jgi:hypothetical protein
MRLPKSDIPANVTERVVEEYSRSRGLIRLEKRKCLFDGRLVGYRYYDDNGRLQSEIALKDGTNHGRAIHWNDDGTLNFIEPYFEGKVHGTAIERSALVPLGEWAIVKWICASEIITLNCCNNGKFPQIHFAACRWR